MSCKVTQSENSKEMLAKEVDLRDFDRWARKGDSTPEIEVAAFVQWLQVNE